jgi:hypothetical protein
MKITAYHHTEQLRIRHLNKGELFRFAYSVTTPAWTKRDGTPGERSVIYDQQQVYRRVSARKVEPVRPGQYRRDSWERIGPVSTLGAGMLDLPVTSRLESW